jgi:3-oxoacyl-[acyl-carrier-protein] synthase-3
MRAATGGAPYARILSLGEHRPANVVTNDDLARRVETNDQWIRDRVGVVTRRIAGPDESVVDMAAAAGGKAIASAGLQPADVDLVIVATCTMPSQIPNASAQVASRLGIRAPGAFDVNAACAGFVYAAATAASAVVSGSARHVLVVGAEKLSDWTDWDDRSTCIIFGDGAGAAVVGPSDEPAIGPVAWGSAGDMADTIVVADRRSYLRQEGQAVFRWATTALVPVAREACELAGVDPKDLAAFVPHQANLRIVEAIARKLGADRAVVARDIMDVGNTSSASIPLALSRMVERDEVPSGAPVLILGFGAGLTYAGQVVLCP